MEERVATDFCLVQFVNITTTHEGSGAVSDFTYTTGYISTSSNSNIAVLTDKIPEGKEVRILQNAHQHV